MDIENMHPFCIPFGLCHDATSSSITADIIAGGQNNNNNNNNNNSSITTNLSSTNSSASSPLSPSSKERRLSNQRSKNSSPSDELFRQLNNISSTTILGQSLLNHHDLIIGGGATSLDIIADESFYSSLGINIDSDIVDGVTIDVDEDGDEENRLRKSSIATTDVEFTEDSDQKLDEDEDWYYNEYSLFSPTRRKSLSSAATIRATNLFHQQVFQHLVDPIDIKSSPTLAQLNLNSNDNDPIDGLWDSTRSSLSSANNHHHHLSSSLSLSSAPTNTDLLSNCTSINKNSSTAGTCCTRTLSNQHQHHHPNHHHHHQNHSSNDNIVCNHLNHHSQTQHHHTHQQVSSPFHSSTAHLASSACPNHQVNHQQHQSSYQQPCRCPTTLQNSAYSAQMKPPNLQQPTCCSNNNNNNNSQTNQLSSPNNNLGSNLKPSATLNELNHQSSSPHQQPNGTRSPAIISAGTFQLANENDGPKKRPSSPALVTSSSSPLSSSTAAPPPTSNQQHQHQQQQQQQQPQFVTSDTATSGSASDNSKLKENIEYLTALLCNGGNKLENNNLQQQNQQQHQPSSISSSMARSYTTLAHTLSTGPKLLERPDLTTISVNQNNTNNHNPTNEAVSCIHDADLQPPGIMSRPQQHIMQQQQQQQHLQQQQQQQQWIKVESSISAADSTDGQTLPYKTTTQVGQHDCSAIGLNPPPPPPQCIHHYNHHHNQSSQQRGPDLRVLSSLLSGGMAKCPQGCVNHSSPAAPTNPNPSLSPCPRWPPTSHGHPHHQQSALQVQTTMNVDSHSMATDSYTSIPPNGRPITLTPITNHNNPILQQQQQQLTQIVASKIKSSPFIQPASPSALSTASSGANTDIGSSSGSSVGPASKKSRLAQSIQAKPSSHKSSLSSSSKGSNRSGRPNSLSTDCSLSSHDEGFSSQIDQDDCQLSTRDSDEEDEVDSDDESFYGDYTNSDLIGASISDDAENKWTLNMGRTRRNGQKRYFWQYNVQSKGPKGTRICSTDDSANPFVLPEASDPVFSNDCQIEGVKHSGKARRGDGNDLTPNPKKLLMIGLELKKLGKIINELAPVTELPINARTKTRKEKNKLASRACRLKKKAQHEANKIKLYGLQREHHQVVLAIYDVRKLLNQAIAQQQEQHQHQKDNAIRGGLSQAAQRQSEPSENDNKRQQQASLTTSHIPAAGNRKNSSQLTSGSADASASVTTNAECINNGAQTQQVKSTSGSVFSIAEQCSMRVAGQTSDFVNSVLEKVVSGCIDGGLET